MTLDGAGAKNMFAFTEKSVGKPMAVLFRETEITTNYNAKGEPLREQPRYQGHHLGRDHPRRVRQAVPDHRPDQQGSP